MPKDADSARREARIGIAIIAVVIIVLSGADSLRRRSKAKARETAAAERQSLLEAAKIVTAEMIDIKPEFAEVYRDRQIRVLFTAKIRDSAASEPTMFAPVLGYFLDQDGNRYDPAVMLVGDETVLDSPPPIPIVPGETYRYYLVAPTQSSPYSNAPPSQRLKKLVVHLPGKSPQQVSIKKPQASLDEAASARQTWRHGVTPPNFTLKLMRPGSGPAAELPTSSPAWRRHGGCRSPLGAAHVIGGNRRAAPASARGPWPHSLA